MTSILERMTATAEPERTPMTTPPPFSRPSPVPWWAGAYGLDPVIPVDDWAAAAQCTAMACGVHVFGVEAGRDERWLPRKASPITRWFAWLAGAVDRPDATRRRLALRLICEQPWEQPDTEEILRFAQEIYAATAVR